MKKGKHFATFDKDLFIEESFDEIEEEERYLREEEELIMQGFRQFAISHSYE
nr:MAG: hypothetical protein [Caudoviricetes sp.]